LAGIGTGAVINRGNVATGAYGIELNNADGVTLSNISVTGAYEGIFVSNGSSQLTVQNSTIFDNANAGLDITDAASSTPVIKDNLFFGDASDANRNQDYGIFSRSQDPTVLRNQAYHNNGRAAYGIYLEHVGSTVLVQDNLFWNNSNTGLVIYASSFDASGNVARDNVDGFYIDDTTSSVDGLFHDNLAYGNTGVGFQLRQ